MEFDNLIKLIRTVSDSKLTDFKYEENGMKISLSKEVGEIQTVVSTFAQDQAPVNGDRVCMQESQTQGQTVTAPLVGIFYCAPAENAEPFVKVGDKVTKGQTLAIIEAMKLMNEIESDYTGTIAEILVENGQAVEYGQPLFRVEA